MDDSVREGICMKFWDFDIYGGSTITISEETILKENISNIDPVIFLKEYIAKHDGSEHIEK